MDAGEIRCIPCPKAWYESRFTFPEPHHHSGRERLRATDVTGQAGARLGGFNSDRGGRNTQPNFPKSQAGFLQNGRNPKFRTPAMVFPKLSPFFFQDKGGAAAHSIWTWVP